MAYTPVSCLEQYLKQLVIPENIYLPNDAHEELSKLQKHTETLRANLEKEGELLQRWVSITGACYEAQDLIDSFISRELDAAKKKSFAFGVRVDLANMLRKLRLHNIRCDLGFAMTSDEPTLQRMPSSSTTTQNLSKEGGHPNSEVLATTDEAEDVNHNEEKIWRLLKSVVEDEKLDRELLVTILGDLTQLAVDVTRGIVLYNTNAKYIKCSKRRSERFQDWYLNNLIAMSYHYVPYYLRGCFIYLAVLPMGTPIPVWKLTRLWIAENLVRCPTDLEGIAKAYLRELIDRKLVMVGEMNYRGEVKTCKVHELIHRFCLSEATEFNLFQAIDSHDFDRKENKLHRISFRGDYLKILGSELSGSHVRSLICFSESMYEDESINRLRSFIREMEKSSLLRVFEGTQFPFSKFDFMFTKFPLLRYLSLTLGNNFKIIPDFMADLWNLETLIINTSCDKFTLNPALSNMKRLRYLKTKAAIVLDNVSNMGNSNIEALHRLSTESCNDTMLAKTPKLQTLSISGDISTLDHIQRLKDLSFLYRLKLIHVILNTTPTGQFVEKFPSWLKILTLSGTRLDWGKMSILGRHPHLESMKLKDNAFCGDEWKVDDGEFNHLQFLKIELFDLKKITGDNSFKRLQFLSAKNCRRLRSIPDRLEKITDCESLSSNKIKREELKPGDHIYYWNAKIFSHHGIYTGDGRVIHYNRGQAKSFASIASSSSQETTGVSVSYLDDFLKGKKEPYLYAYGVTESFFKVKRGGTCTIIQSDTPELVIHRAVYLLKNGGFGPYDLFENNCESFCLYCKTGLVDPRTGKAGGSGQVNANAAAASTAASGIIRGIPTWISSCGNLRLETEMDKMEHWEKVRVEDLVQRYWN